MILSEVFEESIEVLKVNKMRTFLSILGIVIGIGSVIALMTLGQASQESVKARIQSLGSNLLIVRPGNAQEGFLRGAGGITTLTFEDAKAIVDSKRMDTIKNVAGEYSGRAQLSYERNNVNIQIYGVAGDYFNLRNVEVEYGVPFEDPSNNSFEKKVVLGSQTATDLFGVGISPLGQNIRINGTSFSVVGITKSKGSSGFGNADEVAYIPLSTAQTAVFGINYINTLYIGAKDEAVMSAAQNQVGYLLLERHRKATPEDADFTISSQEEILQTVSSITGTFTALLTGIAAISLVVGGIGIMNIMLVTVMERTTEIGLRKALGAKRKTIITQFLAESVILTFVGGLFGVGLGITASYLLTKLANLEFIIAINSVVISVLVSTLIGLLFGWYPAQKAAKMQPIEALRYE